MPKKRPVNVMTDSNPVALIIRVMKLSAHFQNLVTDFILSLRFAEEGQGIESPSFSSC